MLLWNLIKLPFWNVRSGPQLWNNTIDKKTTELVTIELLTTGLLTTELWITELVTTELLKIELWTIELVTTELLTTELWKYEFFDNLTFWQVQLSIKPFIQKFSCQKFNCQKFSCQKFSCRKFSSLFYSETKTGKTLATHWFERQKEGMSIEQSVLISYLPHLWFGAWLKPRIQFTVLLYLI